MEEKRSSFFNPNICIFGETDFRSQRRRFGIKLDDRRRHMYVIGKTGMGKTTLLETMMLHDIYAGHGLGIVDPHGDTAEKIINFIPPERINDVIYFNPADIEYPIGFNILETVNPDHKHLVVSGLMGVFKKIWPDVWSARMEYILNNTLLALLDYPGSTLLGVNRLLADRSYRKKVIAKIRDPIVKAFWIDEFAKYNERYQQEAIAPIQNKVGQFLAANLIRNIVSQVKSTIDIRQIMDEGKIFILNLSKGRIGEDNARLLGGMIITKLQLSAMERVDIPEPKRRDFFLYVDEFQNFATESFANILSEARKYRLALIMAHQYVEQLSEEVASGVFGNVGSMVSFRVGSRDAEMLAKEFEPEFEEEDVLKLEKYHYYIKLMIDGITSVPFSAQTFISDALTTQSSEKVIAASRERYAVNRKSVEEKIMQWSGMQSEGEQPEDMEIQPEQKTISPQSPPPQPPPVPQTQRPQQSEKKEAQPEKRATEQIAQTPIVRGANEMPSTQGGGGQPGGMLQGEPGKKRKRKRKKKKNAVANPQIGGVSPTITTVQIQKSEPVEVQTPAQDSGASGITEVSLHDLMGYNKDT